VRGSDNGCRLSAQPTRFVPSLLVVCDHYREAQTQHQRKMPNSSSLGPPESSNSAEASKLGPSKVPQVTFHRASDEPADTPYCIFRTHATCTILLEYFKEPRTSSAAFDVNDAKACSVPYRTPLDIAMFIYQYQMTHSICLRSFGTYRQI
jgi:hypothetical protein